MGDIVYIVRLYLLNYNKPKHNVGRPPGRTLLINGRSQSLQSANAIVVGRPGEYKNDHLGRKFKKKS